MLGEQQHANHIAHFSILAKGRRAEDGGQARANRLARIDIHRRRNGAIGGISAEVGGNQWVARHCSMLGGFFFVLCMYALALSLQNRVPTNFKYMSKQKINIHAGFIFFFFFFFLAVT